MPSSHFAQPSRAAEQAGLAQPGRALPQQALGHAVRQGAATQAAQLQRALGNRALTALLRRQTASRPPAQAARSAAPDRAAMDEAPAPFAMDAASAQAAMEEARLQPTADGLPAQAQAASAMPVAQRKPSQLAVAIPGNLRSGMFELTGTWVSIEKQLVAYKNLADEAYPLRQAALDRLLLLIQQSFNAYAEATLQHESKKKTMPSSMEPRNTFLSNVLKPALLLEQQEIAATAGGLKDATTPVAADPRMTEQIDGAKGAVFKAKADIVDGQAAKVGEGEAGTAVKLIPSWTDNDLVVKTKSHHKITKEDAANAGANYADVPDGFVRKEDLLETNQVKASAGKKYKSWNDPLQYPLFPHPPVKEDVVQGGLGDCYLLAAAISVVNKLPDHFTKHMVDRKNGTVSVKLYKGVADPVVVTVNKSTVVTDGDEDAYASGPLWVKVLEKAYTAAGFYGSTLDTLPVREKSYGITEGGSGSVAMTHLTGQDAGEMLVAPDRALIATRAKEELGGVIKKYEDKISAKTETEDEFKAFADLQRVIGQLDSLTSTVFFDTNSLEALLEENGIMPETEAYAKIKSALASEENNVLTGPRGSGKYGEYELAFFNEIKTRIDGGKMLTIGSKEKIYDRKEEISGTGHSGGEPKVKGLVGRHAYSVLDYAPKGDELAGKTLSIKLRNPWGNYGRSYEDALQRPIDISTGKPWKGTPLENEQVGEFWIDVAELAAYFDKLHFTN